jgi:hypothetical protein
MSRLEKGTIVPLSGVDNSAEAEFARALAAALRRELKGRRSIVKIIGRWTEASDRAIKNWLAGKAVPSGFHLIALMRRSDAVYEVAMAAAGRGGYSAATFCVGSGTAGIATPSAMAMPEEI